MASILAGGGGGGGGGNFARNDRMIELSVSLPIVLRYIEYLGARSKIQSIQHDIS